MLIHQTPRPIFMPVAECKLSKVCHHTKCCSDESNCYRLIAFLIWCCFFNAYTQLIVYQKYQMMITFPIRKTNINICRTKNVFQRTNTIGKFVEVLGCTWGGPSPLPSNIPQHLLQTTHKLLPIASQWQRVGNSIGLAVS